MILASSSESFLATSKCSDSIVNVLSSFSTPSRVKPSTPITVPFVLEGTLREVSFTSDAFSPNMALKSFSSGDNCVSPFGVILPTKISPALTSAPT